jgi:hypothetical protein
MMQNQALHLTARGVGLLPVAPFLFLLLFANGEFPCGK